MPERKPDKEFHSINIAEIPLDTYRKIEARMKMLGFATYAKYVRDLMKDIGNIVSNEPQTLSSMTSEQSRLTDKLKRKAPAMPKIAWHVMKRKYPDRFPPHFDYIFNELDGTLYPAKKGRIAYLLKDIES